VNVAQMQSEPEPFLKGVRAGLERTERHGLNLPDDVRQNLLLPQYQSDLPTNLREPIAETTSLLQAQEASERFQELFGEMLTVAIVSRDVYNDPPLTLPEIEMYLHQSFSWFNSFRHA